jgi:membrane protein implicated in regulation of membrane protease activity
MKVRRWPYRVIRRYALIQVPGIVLLILALYLLRRWVQIPMWLAGVIVALWIVKDIVLFPFVWRAYDKYDKGDEHSIIGSRGTAEKRLAPTGYVRVGGELWRAEVVSGNPPIEKGEDVRVQGSRGMTLLVVPERNEERG